MFGIPSEVSTKLPLIFIPVYFYLPKNPIDLDYRNYEYNYKFAVGGAEIRT